MTGAGAARQAGLVPDAATLRRAHDATRAMCQPTPLVESTALARVSGAGRAFVKAESLQWAGSFKIRGAAWRLMQLDDRERRRGVVAYSSGNFAQGLAAAGRALGIPVTIVMPVDAPPLKREATRALGARVVDSDHGACPREDVAAETARALADAEGLVLLHPFDDPAIVAGQGGAGVEAIAQLDALGLRANHVVCPVGGGGLLGGVALAFRAAGDARIWAAEPAGFDGMGRSLGAGAITRVAGAGTTICDALQATAPGAAPFAAASAAGVCGVNVADEDVRGAMRFAFEALKLVLEPSGAVALAAVLSGAVCAAAGEVLVVIASGGNIAWDDFQAHLGRTGSAAG